MLHEQFDTKPPQEDKTDAKMISEDDEAKDSTNGSPNKKDQEPPAHQLNGQGDVDFEPAFQ